MKTLNTLCAVATRLPSDPFLLGNSAHLSPSHGAYQTTAFLHRGSFADRLLVGVCVSHKPRIAGIFRAPTRAERYASDKALRFERMLCTDLTCRAAIFSFRVNLRALCPDEAGLPQVLSMTSWSTSVPAARPSRLMISPSYLSLQAACD